jgi:hypothetical protein
MAGIFSTIEHRVKSAALQATGLETISQLIQNNPNDIHMILNFLVVLAYPSNADQSTSQAKQKEKYLDQLENPTNAEMVINSIFRHLNTILSITVDTPLTSYASSIMDSVDAPTVLKSSTTSTRPRAMSGGAAPNDINNEKRVAILTGLCVVFELINNKNLNYVATYSSSLDTQNQTTINNIKELLSKSTETNVKANADKNSTLIENILNTINYDIGFIKSRVVDQSDIQAFKSISQFIDFVNVQKEAAQNILGPIQQAGDLRKLFTKMINTSSDNKNKDQVVKEYETSFNNVVDWLTNYISRDAQEIAEIIQGEKTVSGATGSKTGTKSGVNPAMMTMRGMEGMEGMGGMGMEGMGMEGMGMNPEMMGMRGMGMRGMGMRGMGMEEDPEMGALADRLMPHLMMRSRMMGMGMGTNPMMGMGTNSMMGMNPEMMRMMQMRRMGETYGGSKKTLKNNNNKREKGKKKKIWYY